jgi:uncharacterized protein (TIGR02301 family)
MNPGRWRDTRAAIAAGMLAALTVLAVSPASAQFPFFWGREERSAPAQSAPKPPPAPPAAPLPVPSDDKPYDTQLFRLAEILGTLHYLRELCGANEGQVWREHMRELAASEGGTSALRRARLVESFNRGYRDYSRTYRTCTQPALVAIHRFMDQASTISDGLIANDK